MNNMSDKDKEHGNDQANGLADWQGADANPLPEVEAEDNACIVAGASRDDTAMMLLGICMISMLGVYLFGRHQKPQEASAEEKAVEAQVDMALAKLVSTDQKAMTKQLFNDTETMVQAFYEYPTNQQVLLDDLQKNPFSRFSAESDEDQNQDKSQAQLEKELRRKLSQLELQTIAGAKCLINGEIFDAGQKVIDTFNIKTINANNVVLEAGGLEFVLQM